MKLFYAVLGLWLAHAGHAGEMSANVGLPIAYQKEALANSLRCLDTIRGDEYRTALTRSWAAENLAYFGDEAAAVAVLRRSTPHYVIPYGCVEAALTLLGHGQNQAVRQLVDLTIELMPMMPGWGEEEVLLKTVKLATVLEYPAALDRAWSCLPKAKGMMDPVYQAFLQDWRPSLWNRLLDWLRPGRQWADLKPDANRDEQIAWNRGRVADAYTAMLFIKEAEARVRRGEGYPAHWIEFARAGVRAPSPNTRPIAMQAELAALAALEGRKTEAMQLVQQASDMMQGWPAQMTGIYPVLRDLASLTSLAAAGEEAGKTFLGKISEWKQSLLVNLDPYEQMLQLPLLAEGCHVLGAKQEAEETWQKAAELCAANQNPESQSIGLTRIWMSYARANTWPDKKTEALLAKIEKKLPEEYAKVNF